MRLLLLTLTLFLGTGATAFCAGINLVQNAEISNSVIRLGDIAGFELDDSIAGPLAAVPVCQAPEPGERLTLRSIDIKRNLVKTGKVPASLSWQGPGSVTVQRRGVEIGPDRVQSIIDDFLTGNRGILPRADVRFIPRGLPLPFFIPVGTLECQVIPSHPGILGSSRFSIIFKVDGTVVKNMSVRGRVEAVGEVIVAARPLRRGTILSAAHLGMAVVDISSEPDAAMDAAQLIGKELQKNVTAGSPLSLGIVESLPIVYRGQKVKIVLSTGNLLITATGLAHSDGRQEDMIRVQNLSSNKMLYCRVAAPGLVEVIL